MASLHFSVKAIHDYSSPHDDDLSFPNGQIITVTDEEDADWYYGEYADASGSKQAGLFPKNFVKLYEPETPPRPSKQGRPKKEPEPSAASNEPQDFERAEDGNEYLPQAVPVQPPSEHRSEITQSRIESQPLPTQTPKSPELSSAAPPIRASTKPVPPSTSKPAPPPIMDKPAVGSFRDRINAFNKPAAPPVAPMKPNALGSAAGSSFVKKPFVAPPPSKNAYVPPPRETPPQRIYRREEDPEVIARSLNGAETELRPTQVPRVTAADNDEDQPKPISLKDRIALLQRQQMEQAARHAEAGQKKEKPKRPLQKRTDSQEGTVASENHAEDNALGGGDYPGVTGKQSLDAPRDDTQTEAPPFSRPSGSRSATLVGSPITQSRGFRSDANDADQSGADDTEGEEMSAGREDSDEVPRSKASGFVQKSHPPTHEPGIGDYVSDEESDANEDDQDTQDIDPELKRRMEIRERMAKMSGGMGMAGMFGPSAGGPSAGGPSAGMPPVASKRQNSGPGERKPSGSSTVGSTDAPVSRAPPIPVMSMPGLQRVRSAEEEDSHAEESKEQINIPKSFVHEREPDDMPDVEDMKEEPITPSRRSIDRAAPLPVPQDRPVPAPPSQTRAAPPPLPTERPAPQRTSSRPVPRPPPSQPISPSEGSESDDEMSIHARSLSLQVPGDGSSPPLSREGPPAIPYNGLPPSLPNRAQNLESPRTDYEPRSPNIDSREMSPTSPTSAVSPAKRFSRVPPIPGSSPALPSAPQSRAPPPPPPAATPSSRASTADNKLPQIVPLGRTHEGKNGEVIEYDGGYDMNVALGPTHKDALKSHARVPSLEENSIIDDATLHHSGLPSLMPLSAAPRAVPPPPPHQPPRHNRQSSEMPRAPPPPPPRPKEQDFVLQSDEYDPYRNTPGTLGSSRGREEDDFEGPTTPTLDDPDGLYSASPPRRSMPPPPPMQDIPQYSSPPSLFVSGRQMPRQSSEVQRTVTNTRRSIDAPRASGEHGFIAGDVELGHNSQWWTQPKLLPPVLQNRRDVVCEIRESSPTHRGSQQAVTKIVHILYMDYSQTVVRAHFEIKDPSNASLEQTHEPPPPRLRQDQLEDAHIRFGSRIAESALSRKETVVGDGTPHTLVLDLLSSLPEALLPVGVRAYGALVYANLANASIQQFDEIRSGDIVTFRNAKFQGHRGPMHTKYSIEVGKPDHVGVVVDWDGTKKKVRAWEQGRESKRVKMESFKLGDMRSGEVKVWRVMPRQWIGW